MEIGGNYSTSGDIIQFFNGFNSRIAQCSSRSKFSCYSISRFLKWVEWRAERSGNVDFQGMETSLTEVYDGFLGIYFRK